MQFRPAPILVGGVLFIVLVALSMISIRKATPPRESSSSEARRQETTEVTGSPEQPGSELESAEIAVPAGVAREDGAAAPVSAGKAPQKTHDSIAAPKLPRPAVKSSAQSQLPPVTASIASAGGPLVFGEPLETRLERLETAPPFPFASLITAPLLSVLKPPADSPLGLVEFQSILDEAYRQYAAGEEIQGRIVDEDRNIDLEWRMDDGSTENSGPVPSSARDAGYEADLFVGGVVGGEEFGEFRLATLTTSENGTSSRIVFYDQEGNNRGSRASSGQTGREFADQVRELMASGQLNLAFGTEED